MPCQIFRLRVSSLRENGSEGGCYLKKSDRLTLEEWIVGITMVVMFVVTTVNVLGRYFLNLSLAFVDEATTYVFIWTIFFGAAAACVRGENLGMDSIVAKLPPRAQKAFVMYVTIISAALYALLCYQGVIMVKTHILNKLVTASSGIPNWIFSIAVPISAVFYIVRSIQYAIAVLKELNAQEVSEEQQKGGAN